MCGIIGSFNNKNSDKIVSKGLEIMQNRGKDGSDLIKFKNNCIGHNLHAIVDLVKQPIEYQGSYLIANCEIYNWKELNKKYNLKAKNDAETIIKLISKKGIEKIKDILQELDGIYAFCYTDQKKAIIARDLLGIKPLWYNYSSSLSFASEKKALLKNNIYDCIELNPRKIIEYDITNNEIKYIERDFFDIKPEHKKDIECIKKELYPLLENAIKKRITDKKIGVLFSGGIDSVFIAYILKKLNIKFTCYTAALEEKNMEKADDFIYAEKAAQELGLNLKIIKINLKKTENYIKKIIPLIETTNVVKVGVALPFFLCCEKAKQDGVKVMFSGLGSEEIFAGYERHSNARNVNEECVSGLLKMYERDLYRDDVVSMANTVEIRLPFLDKKLINYALKINEEYKLKDNKKKVILRYVSSDIGIPDTFAWRKKKAAQYGSKFDRAIEKLAKKKGYKLKAEYLNSLSNEHNLNLGIMWSSGKDSCYATYLMKKHNYNIKCLLTVKSRNKYSYMFHTPNIDMSKMQAEAMEVPFLTVETKGEKEDELKDMEKLLQDAKNKYNIDGIVTGALFSSYQRKRIEKIADNVGLKIFSPLWHKNQKELMKEIINSKFKVILSSIAAEGLDEKWLGKIIEQKEIDKLIELKNKIGINVAGEGGEFESFVLDCPLFKKKIVIKEANIIKENNYNMFYIINKAKLEKK